MLRRTPLRRRQNVTPAAFKDFQFRQMKKIRVFDSPEDLPKERSSLLAISNRYGLTFVGQDRTLKVFSTQDIITAAKVEGNTNEIVEDVDCQAVCLDLPVHHLSLSSDELTLSVCGASEESPLTLDFYDVRTFFNKARQEKRPFASYKPLAAPDSTVQDLKWSPVEAFRLAACLSGGSMMVLDVTNSVTLVAQLPDSVGITCVCWSPKGKQVAAGKQNATVVQYTPNLQEKKVIPCPNFYSSENPVKVLDVLWLSTFNFAVAYAAADGSPETPPELVVVSLPKKDEKREEKNLNFSDLVYGTCTERQHHYFLCHIEDWDLVLAASAASIEVSIIAKQDDKTNWELWVLEDASRGELPVTLTNDDTLPVGVGIDYTSQGEIHLSDEKKLPPAPTLLILSTDGVLCPFSLLNLNPGVKQLVTAAGSLALDGERPPLAKSSAAPPARAPAASNPPSVFPSFPMPTTAAPAAPHSVPSMAPASSSSSSFGLPFTLPAPASAGASVFSFSSSTSAFPSSSIGAFSSSSSTASAFAPSIKPPTESSGAPALGAPAPAAPALAPQRVATASPITVLKPPAEPATPNVRMNLTDRFLSAETPAPPAPAVQPFSLTSTPKPTALTTSVQPTPQFSISKPTAGVLTRPIQTSAPSAAVPKPATQTPSVKTLEKQVQQKKDVDPVMAGILEEIAHFQKEMDELKTRSNRADFRVGSSEEMRDLRKESEDLHGFSLEIKETTESLHGDISTLKTTLLEGFAGVEEARAQRELNRDKGYLQLLYKKPLDPRSEQQLKEIRKLYQYVKFAVEDVNDVLDLEWEKHLEKKKKQKHMIVPEREALYTSLANNMDIINQQKQKLDQLVRDLQSLRLYNKTSNWSAPSRPASTPSSRGLDNELESLRNALLKASLETAPKVPSKSPSKMTPVKQSQLRNFLSKRQTPPVRSTAPANLSRSAFLSPKYYEDLDDVSSTSSLSQPLEPDEPLAVGEEEEEEEEPPALPVLTPRHPAVVRTTSIQPRFIQSTPFSRVQSGPGPVSSPVLPKINMDSADSTALATKTVKHGPPPTEKATPTTISASQAAARAALNRQMISQKPARASLTESTLKTVPQVVNVQELKDKGPALPVSTVISSSVPAPAAQVVQQVLATVEAKKNSSQAAVKVPPPVTESAPAPQAFVFAPKADAPAASTSSSFLKQQNSKAFTFSTASPALFSFSLNSTSSQSQGADSSQAPGSRIFGQPAVSSSSAAPPATSFTPVISTSTAAAPSATVTPFAAAASAPAPAAVFGNNAEQASKFSFSSSSGVKMAFGPSETPFSLGPFSDLRVGAGDEAKEPPKGAAGFTFGVPGKGGAASFTFSSLHKPAASGNGSDSDAAPAEAPKAPAPLGLPAASSVFKPPEFAAPSTTKPAATATSFSSLLAAPLPSETTASAEQPQAPPSSGPSPPPDPAAASALTPEERPTEPSVEPPAQATPSTVPVSEVPVPVPSQPEVPAATGDKLPTQATSALSVAPTPPSSATPPAEPAAAVEPAAPEAKPTPAPTASANLEQAPPAPAAVTTAAPPSTTPGSIFAQPVATTIGTTLPVTSFTPVISTATVAATTSTTVTPLAPSTTAQTPASIFGQPAATTAAPAFGSTTFGAASTTSAFGKSVFGQVAATSFGQPATAAAGSASGFTFGQSSFGTGSGFGQTANAAANAPASSAGGGGGGLFGSSSTSSASSFSFGASSTSSGASTGTNLFGQSSSPAFGQQGGGFGQGPLFGSSTTTTTSSGFGFGQPAAFGSTPTSSVFGQQPSGGSVFGQASSGGSLFGSGASNTSSSGVGFFSGLGGKPSEDAANKNPFGTNTTGGFGQTSQTGAPSLFGNSGAKTFGFGTSSFGEQKPAGTFSAGGGSVAAQGFGSFSTPAKAGGFGSAPVFGSPPAFGSSPAFGGTATFGSSPSFNNQMGSSPGKVFGEGTAAASVGGFGFGSPSSGPSFGAIANQGSPSFGSLAQQNTTFGAQSGGGGGFSAFGSSAGFGGFGTSNTNQPGNQTFGGWRS